MNPVIWRVLPALLAILSLFFGGEGYAHAKPVSEDTSSHINPHAKVIVLGQEGQGRAAVTSAITKVLSEAGGIEFIPVAKLKHAPEDKTRGITLAMSYIEYEIEKRRYRLVYLPKHTDCVKSLITGRVRVDGAMLVVASDHGPTSQTEEDVKLARATGVRAFVVFLNIVGNDRKEQQLESVEQKIRALLSLHGYSGDKTPIIRGSAEAVLEERGEKSGKQAIGTLLAAMDSHIPNSPRLVDLPFLMPIEDVFSIMGRGTVVTGRVEYGRVNVGDKVQIVGLRPTARTVVTGIEMFRKLLDRAEAGDNIGVLLRGTKRGEVERGQVLATPGSIKAHTKFKAEVYLLTEEEGGRHTLFFSNYRPQFYFRTTEVTGVVKLPDETEMMKPGDNGPVAIELVTPVAMEKRLRFAIRESGRTVGVGVVAEVVE